MSDGTAKYQIFVRIDTEVGKKFREIIKTLENPVTGVKPTKTDVIELAINELYSKYVKDGKGQ